MQRQILCANQNMFHVNVLTPKERNIPEGVEMVVEIHVGDHVKLLGLPDWLIHDLPVNEQEELRLFVGQFAIVCEVDSYGYFWLGFGNMTEVENFSHYSGHSFGVPREFIELVSYPDSPHTCS
jgi:hypothetical protein